MPIRSDDPSPISCGPNILDIQETAKYTPRHKKEVLINKSRLTKDLNKLAQDNVKASKKNTFLPPTESTHGTSGRNRELFLPVNYFVHTPSTCVKGLSFMAVACLLAPSCKTPAMTKIINYLGNLTD